MGCARIRLKASPAYPEHVPNLAGTPWLEQNPVPMVARRGQMLILCSSGLHSAWQNEDHGAPQGDAFGLGRLRRYMRTPERSARRVDGVLPTAAPETTPERAHIVPEGL